MVNAHPARRTIPNAICTCVSRSPKRMAESMRGSMTFRRSTIPHAKDWLENSLLGAGTFGRLPAASISESPHLLQFSGVLLMSRVIYAAFDLNQSVQIDPVGGTFTVAADNPFRPGGTEVQTTEVN